LVDSLGIPLFVYCTTANLSDDAGIIQIIKDNIEFFLSLPFKSEDYALTILLDSGYHKDFLEKSLVEIHPDILSRIEISIAPKISKEEKAEQGLSGFVVTPMRWIVERSNAWMEKCRVLWKNCERQLSTSVAKIKICFIRILINRLCPKPKTEKKA
jgi:transposase